MLKFNNAVEPIAQNNENLEEINTGEPVSEHADIIQAILGQEPVEEEQKIEEVIKEPEEEITPTEEEEIAGELELSVFEDYIPDLAKHLYDKGHIKHIPEDVDLDEFNLEAYEKTIAFDKAQATQKSFKEGADAMQKNIMDRLSPFSQKLILYNLDNPNASNDEIKSLTNELAASEYLLSLDPEKNAEEIVREYYREAKWSNADIDSKVDRLISSDSLEKEAEIVKPKLDEAAKEIAANRTKESASIKKYEQERRQKLQTSVAEKLNTGKLNDLPLDKETADFLYAAILNEETPVMLGNRKVHMGYSEALMRYHKYEGNLENVMLSLLVLKDGPEAIQKHFARKAKNEEVLKHVKEVKFSNSRKKSSVNTPRTNKLSSGISFKMT